MKGGWALCSYLLCLDGGGGRDNIGTYGTEILN